MEMDAVMERNLNCKPLLGAAQHSTAGVQLSGLRSGDSGVVLGFAGKKELYGRMMALGIIPGKTVTVINGAKRQPFILRIDESRMMVDWQTLNQIIIAPVKAGPKGGDRP
jgi:Fe2+ transport system protein FeoA